MISPIKLRIVNQYVDTMSNLRFIPKLTKKRREKKSLIYLILLIISSEYSVLPRSKPAMNAPITTDNPNTSEQ